MSKANADCSWGMGKDHSSRHLCFLFYIIDYNISDSEDASEINSENPFAVLEAQNEELYIDDPKKALRGFFEREGNKLHFIYIIMYFFYEL